MFCEKGHRESLYSPWTITDWSKYLCDHDYHLNQSLDFSLYFLSFRYLFGTKYRDFLNGNILNIWLSLFLFFFPFLFFEVILILNIFSGEKPYTCQWPECNNNFARYSIFYLELFWPTYVKQKYIFWSIIWKPHPI